ncbi:hypothetical protein [Frankia sp. Cj3]|uniref:hypothetical protein n=1 Tax=Frankia sp. Cj3 TaxID=2880976 RepID=UPI001EF7307B|nr:hypothetical protein [Frankia sp. Cj3]
MIPNDTLARSARSVLDQLHPVDFDRIRVKFTTLDDPAQAKNEIVADMVERAASMLDELRKRGDDVPPEQLDSVLGATLTFGDQHCGVHKRTGHALAKLAVMTRRPDVPVAVAVLLRAGDSAELVDAMVGTYHLEADLAAEYAAVPPDDRRMVAAAIAANPRLTAAVPDPLAAAVGVLGRAGELAAYCAAAGMTPPAPPGPLGNVAFLLTLAGYSCAITELARPSSVADPYGKVGDRAKLLATALHRAMHDTGNPLYSAPYEPDILGFYTVAAEAVGGALAAKVFERLSRDLWAHRLRRDERSIPAESDWLDHDSDAPDLSGAFDQADELARLMAALLVADTAAASRRVIVAWVLGPGSEAAAEDLYVLLGGVRRVMAGVSQRDCVPPPVDELAVKEARELETALLGRLTEEARRDPHRGAVEMAAAVMPELWARRPSAIRGLTEKIWADLGSNKRLIPFARILAAAVARGPGQVVFAGQLIQHPIDTRHPSCETRTTQAGTERCEIRVGKPGPPRAELCPARPWGETGFVDSHLTLADTLPTTTDAMRKRLHRYDGPWASLAKPGRA